VVITTHILVTGSLLSSAMETPYERRDW
jgi:hypothetical protein